EAEQRERQKEEPARSPQVGQPAGQGHRDDVDEQIAVDDPRGVAELGDVREIAQDRRQGDGRDHQLEARQEDPDTEHAEQRNGVATGHRAGGRQRLNRVTACLARTLPMASDEVAAGDGAFLTWRTRPVPAMSKSSTRLPSGATAWARTPDG